MFYKVASETTYEKMERGRKSQEEEGVERERESRLFVYALSSINGLRFTHFVSNWASLFFIK